MASIEVEITLSSNKFGSIIFNESPPSLEIKRTAVGVDLTIPAGIKFASVEKGDPNPIVSDIRAVISMVKSPQSEIELGRAYDPDYYEVPLPQPSVPLGLVWSNVLPALVYIERNRPEIPVQLEIVVRAELSFGVLVTGAPHPEYVTVQPLHYRMRTVPRQRIYGRVFLTYASEVWQKMIQKAFEASRHDPYLLMEPLHRFLQPRRENQTEAPSKS